MKKLFNSYSDSGFVTESNAEYRTLSDPLYLHESGSSDGFSALLKNWSRLLRDVPNFQLLRSTEKSKRIFAETNMALMQENATLRRLITNERDYANKLIRMNLAIQNLLTIKDRKLLLRSVTTSLCEEMQFTAAILWIYDQNQKTLVPISWYNAALEQISQLRIQTQKKPYIDLLQHRKSYFIVDDLDSVTGYHNDQIDHIHTLRSVLNSEAVYLIPIVSLTNIERAVEEMQKETQTVAILMVGQQNKTRIMESKEILQRYAYAVGLTLEHLDIYSYLHQNYQIFKKQAVTDGLTGIYNRRFFNEELSREIERSHRHFLRMSLLMIDIDHFKKINDAYGHSTGDWVLKKIARVLRDTTRVCDIECRYGGEEFALILPETTTQQALIIAEKLRQEIASTKFTDENGHEIRPITLSIGVATFPDHASKTEELIHHADQGLYTSKANGRNAVTVLSATEHTYDKLPIQQWG